MISSFKEFLKEYGEMDSDMTPAEYARYKRQREMNPKRAAMQQAKKQDLEAKAAKSDDTVDPETKRAEDLEARAARSRLRAAQQKKQNEVQ